MDKKIWWILLTFAVLVIGVVTIACGSGNSTGGPSSQPTTDGSGYISITSDQLAQMLKAKDFYFVNVHTPYVGEIEGTDAKIPYDQIRENLDKFPKDPSAKIVLYCMSGAMSKTAVQTLVAQGYTNVSDLKGGMSAWEQAGYQLVKK